MSIKKFLLITGVTSGAGAVCFFTGGLAAPIIGTLIGNGLGLSGCAATSAGLAAIGGGSLASGGAGMAGGALVIKATTCITGSAIAATTSTATAASIEEARTCQSCDAPMGLNDKACGNCGKKHV